MREASTKYRQVKHTDKMKISFRHRIAALATAALSTITTITPSLAATFAQAEVDQDRFIAIAQPLSSSSYKLLIVEQITDERECWGESGSNPVEVEPLLLNFDFTGICGRSTDSNGYSIRMAGEDLGLQYSLRVVKRGNDIVLIGAPSGSRKTPEIEIGRTKGVTSGFAKIVLNPGWRFTKRSYNNKTLGHVYFTSDLTLASLGTSNPNPDPNPDPNPNPTDPNPVNTATFRDVANDIYAKEIQQAVALGFVAGYKEDNTFRPQVALTREQLVSMVLEALSKLPSANLGVPSAVSSSPYPDVDASRWSAAKIQWARDKNIVKGYEDGTFRPSKPVTRAELIAVLRRAAEFGNSLRGKGTTLTPTASATTFSDTDNHWAASLVSEMSSYCKVASPVNETGNNFYPDDSALRNYAATATLRMLNCVKAQ